jgi:hypothetical protein
VNHLLNFFGVGELQYLLVLQLVLHLVAVELPKCIPPLLIGVVPHEISVPLFSKCLQVAAIQL